ncbi:MAG: hypothetical protein Q8M03_16645 [Legionella sp.]|nr:hypothetical protein [Legionella sp.]
MIKSYSLAFIRAQLIANPSIDEVAAELNTTPILLKEQLARLQYQGEPVTVEFLKKPNLEDFIEAYDNDYSKPIASDKPNALKFELSNYSMKQAHALIRITRSIKDAAKSLGVAAYTLNNQLKSFNPSRTFKQWQDLTIEDALNTEGAKYTKPLNKITRDLTGIRLSEVHYYIRNTPTLYDAAIAIGINDRALRILLSRSALKLTEEHLRNNDKKTLKEQYGKVDYNKPIKISYTHMSKRSLAYIHAEALASREQISTTAYNLKEHVVTFCQYLSRVDYNGSPLTFEALTHLSPDAAKDIWRERYYKRLEEIYSRPVSRKRKRPELDHSNDEDQRITPPFPVVRPLRFFNVTPAPQDSGSTLTTTPAPETRTLSQEPAPDATSLATPVAGALSATGTPASQPFFNPAPDILSKLFAKYAVDNEYAVDNKFKY